MENIDIVHITRFYFRHTSYSIKNKNIQKSYFYKLITELNALYIMHIFILRKKRMGGTRGGDFKKVCYLFPLAKRGWGSSSAHRIRNFYPSLAKEH